MNTHGENVLNVMEKLVFRKLQNWKKIKVFGSIFFKQEVPNQPLNT
jgi:hypothetical protein